MKRNVKTIGKAVQEELFAIGSDYAAAKDTQESLKDRMRRKVIEITKAKDGDVIVYESWLEITKYIAAGFMAEPVEVFMARKAEPAAVKTLRNEVKRELFRENNITITEPEKSQNKDAVRKRANKEKSQEFLNKWRPQIEEVAVANSVSLSSAAAMLAAGVDDLKEKEQLVKAGLSLEKEVMKSESEKIRESIKRIRAFLKAASKSKDKTMVSMLHNMAELTTSFDLDEE